MAHRWTWALIGAGATLALFMARDLALHRAYLSREERDGKPGKELYLTVVPSNTEYRLCQDAGGRITAVKEYKPGVTCE